MRATLHSAALASHAGQFVWLDVDYDDPRNEAFLATHFNAGYPVLMIIDPVTGLVRSLWAGTATEVQLLSFLEEAMARPASDADRALQRGDSRFGSGDLRGAAAAYEQALAAGGAMWSRRDHALEQLLGMLQATDPRACVARAGAEAPHMPRSHTFVNVALSGVSCLASDPSLAGALPDDARRLEALAVEALAAPSASQDDHYQLYEALYALRQRAGDTAGAHAIAEQYLRFAEHTPAPGSDDERMARDLALVRAAVKLGAPDRVIGVLEASERALPDDDNASARLASAYTAAHRYADAIAACTRGLARKPGPGGAVRLLGARASAEAQAGDTSAARRDLQAASDMAARITVPVARELAATQIRHQLDGLPGAR